MTLLTKRAKKVDQENRRMKNIIFIDGVFDLRHLQMV
jgi:hypothetical protein